MPPPGHHRHPGARDPDVPGGAAAAAAGCADLAVLCVLGAGLAAARELHAGPVPGAAHQTAFPFGHSATPPQETLRSVNTSCDETNILAFLNMLGFRQSLFFNIPLGNRKKIIALFAANPVNYHLSYLVNASKCAANRACCQNVQ